MKWTLAGSIMWSSLPAYSYQAMMPQHQGLLIRALNVFRVCTYVYVCCKVIIISE